MLIVPHATIAKYDYPGYDLQGGGLREGGLGCSPFPLCFSETN